jgi:AraC-like DNA-binding protein
LANVSSDPTFSPRKGDIISHLFTTDTLPASDRIDAWRWNAQQICGDCRIKLPKSSFHGTIEIRTVGGLNLTRFSSSPLAFWKWPCDTVSIENRCCIVITQLAGMRHYLQNGISVLLRPGDSTLIDSGRPWCSSSGTDCVRLYLRVPVWMMENRLRRRGIPIAERICGGSGLGAALHRISRCLYDEAEQMSEQEGVTSLDAYFAILAGCFSAHASLPSGPTSAFRGRIQQFIDMHLSDPALGPAEIASAFGISVRHLHRLVSVTGNTLGDHIRMRRLEKCRNDLVNPRLCEKTITEIAFSWGFSDAAHFSHCFRKQFGTSPRAFRAQTKNYADDELPVDFLRPDIAKLRYSRPN